MQNAEFVLRLFLAGVMGAAIGLEREFRAKEAGFRTHFLVALGSALLMIVSQWGFQTSEGVAGTRHADVARVAAQIVSGIGFLGAGTIIVQKHSVRGLTTAAGLWVAAGIGMAIGGGLYLVGSVATAMALLGLELFQYLFRNIKPVYVIMEFSTKNRDRLINVTNSINEHGCKVVQCAVKNKFADDTEHLSVTMHIRAHPHSIETQLYPLMQTFPDIVVERIE